MGYGTQKPPPGSQFCGGHPLMAGIFDCLLFSEGAGLTATNSANSAFPAKVTGVPTWRPTPAGLSAYCTGGSSFDIPDHGNIAAGDFSVRVVHRPTTWNAGGYTALYDKGTAGNTELAMYFGTTGNLSFSGAGKTGSGTTLTTAMTIGVTWDYITSRTGAVISHYVNGRLIGTNTINAYLAVAGAVFSFGRNPSTGGSNYDGAYILAQTWRRALQPGEVAWLYADRYAGFEPVRRKTFGVSAIAFRRGAGNRIGSRTAA